MSCVGNQIDLAAQRLAYDPVRGETLTRVFEGTLEACFAQAIALRQNRPDLSFVLETADGPLWRITDQSPDFGQNPGLEATTTWELVGNDIQKDIYEADFALSIPEPQLTIVRDAMVNEKTVSEVQEDLGDAALVLLTLLKRGTTSFLEGQYVLRKSQFVSSKTEIRVAFSNTGGVFSTAALISAESIPDGLIFSILEIPIPSIPESAGSVVVNSELYARGWLKKTPTVTQVQGNKFEIRQEYWLDIWAVDLYPFIA